MNTDAKTPTEVLKGKLDALLPKEKPEKEAPPELPIPADALVMLRLIKANQEVLNAQTNGVIVGIMSALNLPVTTTINITRGVIIPAAPKEAKETTE